MSEIFDTIICSNQIRITIVPMFFSSLSDCVREKEKFLMHLFVENALFIGGLFIRVVMNGGNGGSRCC